MGMYTSLRIVCAPSAATYRGAAADSYEGASMDSAEVLTIMNANKWRSLLVEGRAGIGKSTWTIHLATHQAYAQGLVILLRLSEVAKYLSGKQGALSARELLHISFGEATNSAALVERVHYHLRLAAVGAVWLVDGLDEVIADTSPLLQTLLGAVGAAVSGAPGPAGTPFGPHDSVVVTSREERGGKLSDAKLVATINPWTNKEATGFIRNYFSQVTVRSMIAMMCLNGEDPKEKVAGCVKEASAIVADNRFGSFSTLPIVLEMICWLTASPQDVSAKLLNISALYTQTVSAKLRIARQDKSLSPPWTTSDEEIIELCKRLCKQKSGSGVFFELNCTTGGGRDLLRSGLVREQLGFNPAVTTVRFVHKSFLEYFQALHFASQISELGAHHDVPIDSMATADGRVECVVFTSPDDAVRVACARNMTVRLELQCCRSLNSDVEIIWLVGQQEKASYDLARQRAFSTRYRPSNNVTCQWKDTTSTTKMIDNIDLVAGTDYFLVLRPVSGSSMVPVRCRWAPTHASDRGIPSFTLTMQMPICDIPSRQQQRNFFQFLTHFVKDDANGKRELMAFLICRLKYHHPRVSSWLASPERSLSSPLMPGEGLTGGHSKARILAETGLSIVTECAASLLELPGRLGAMLDDIKESSSNLGSLVETVGLRPKSICEWALLPCAAYGSWALWEGLQRVINSSRLRRLHQDGTMLREAMIAALVNRRTDIASHLSAQGVTTDVAVACRLGATDVVLDEVRRRTAGDHPGDDVADDEVVDAVFSSALLESLKGSQIDTATAVWETLVTFNAATPRVWKLVFSSLNGRLPEMLPSVAEAWLQSRFDVVAEHLSGAPRLAVEHQALEELPRDVISRAVHARVLTTAGLLSAEMSVAWRHAAACLLTAPIVKQSVVNVAIDFSRFPSPLYDRVSTECDFDAATTVNLTNVACTDAIRLTKSIVHAAKKNLVTLGITRSDYQSAIDGTMALPTLRHLTVQHCINFTDSDLQHISCFDQLQLLDLTGCESVTDGGLVGVSRLLHLERFILSGCSRITDAGLSSIATSLLQLDLTGCIEVTDAGLSNVARLVQLQHLDLNGCNSITDAGLSIIAALPHLKHLGLSGCYKITDIGLKHISNLQQLEFLDLDECVDITDAGLGSISRLARLQQLRIRSCANITSSGVGAAARLQQLQHFDISGCVLVTAAGVGRLSQFTELQHLDISRCDLITDSSLGSIAQLHQLVDVSIAGCSKVTDSGVSRLAQLPQLQRLNLAECCDITDAAIDSVAQLPQLLELNLARCHKLTDASLLSISRVLQLRRLDLSECRKITDVGLGSMSGLMELQYLRIKMCSMVTGSGLKCLPPRLVHLDLSGCSDITDERLTSVSLLHHLQHLDLGGCSKLADVGVRSLAQLFQLQHLNLTGCSEVTDDGLGHVVSRCQLHHLDLTGCHKITDAGLLSSIPRLLRLEYLSLSMCSKLTDACLGSVARLLQLQHLNLSWCTNITNAGLSRILHLGGLQHLDLSWCINVTDAGIGKLQRLYQLQRLNINGCASVTDSGLAAIARLMRLQLLQLDGCGAIGDAGLASLSQLHALQHLSLNGCSNITNVGLSCIAQLQQLHHLDLSRCSNITDAGLGSVAQLLKLRYLDVSWCANVTDVGLGVIARLPVLQHVNLSRCTEITDAGVAAAVHLLPQLQHLDLIQCKVSDAGVAAARSASNGLTVSTM